MKRHQRFSDKRQWQQEEEYISPVGEVSMNLSAMLIKAYFPVSTDDYTSLSRYLMSKPGYKEIA